MGKGKNREGKLSPEKPGPPKPLTQACPLEVAGIPSLGVRPLLPDPGAAPVEERLRGEADR